MFFTNDNPNNTKPIFYLNLFGTGDEGVTVVWKLAPTKQKLLLYDTQQPNSAGESCAMLSDMTLVELGATDARCERGTWCQFVVTWTRDTITATGIDADGGESSFSEAFKPHAHETGPIMLGAGYVFGEAWFGRIEEEGGVPAPTRAPTAAPPHHHYNHNTPKPTVWQTPLEYSFGS